MYNSRLIQIAIFLALIYFSSSSPLIKDDASSCTRKCPVSVDKINVHLVPHSHDDVGWLSTVDQYYKGTGEFKSSKDAGVKYILDSTLQALKKKPERTYVQVETAFFYRWWKDQNDANRKAFVDLVNKGQIEMVNGAWSMNDEADTNYQSIIDQFTWGLRILNKTVGACGRPKIGWQIDPFGHSETHASLISQMGFEGLVLGRIDHKDKDDRTTNKKLDFNWKIDDSRSIFTTIFPDFYTYPNGFCFDVLCSDTFNKEEEQIKKFTEILDKYSQYYKTKNILIPLGGDFNYQKAEQNYENSDKLIDAFEKNDKYHLFYSTPSCYVETVKSVFDKNAEIKPEEKNGDFFPYSSDDHSFWAGYFTSRPTVKRFERVGNNILQSAKQLTTFSRINNKDNDQYIIDLRRAMGVMQHHDAITGTEKQAVALDYVRKLHHAIKKVEEPVGSIIANLLLKEDQKVPELKLSTCLLANISICTTSVQDKFLVAVQNPLSQAVTHHVRLPVNGEAYKITGPSGVVNDYNVFDSIHSFDYVKEKSKPATKELVFKAENIPALGINLYYLEKTEKTEENSKYVKFVEKTDVTSLSVSDELGFTWDQATGKLTSVTINKKPLKIMQDFLAYDGAIGGNAKEDGSDRTSGAYIFRPDGDANPINKDKVKVEVADGSYVKAIRQTFNDEVTQIIRIYPEELYIEFDWLVGDLQNVNNKGREIITRFTVNEPNFATGGVFYTDSNGRKLIQRQNIKDVNEPIASNYYPVTSRIVIKDPTSNLEVAVLNDRAQGGASLKDQWLELMVHRRLKKDDGFGVGEALDEKEYDKGVYARGQYYLTFNPSDKSTIAELVHKKLLEPWMLVGTADEEKITTALNYQVGTLTADLPEGVEILTLEPWMDTYILRLENILASEEGGAPHDINIMKIFKQFDIVKYAEVLLGVNFATETENLDFKDVTEETKITLKPLEIKTILIVTNQNNNGGYADEDIESENSAQSLTVSFFLIVVAAVYNLF